MKKCTHCGVLKDEKEFIDDKGQVVKTCRGCREYNKEYRERNREQIKEYNKEYRERNREQLKEYMKGYNKEYYERNKGQIKEYVKEYHKEHRERIRKQRKEQRKEYYERNRKRIREYAKEYMKEYRERSKEQIKEYRKEYNSRPAKYETYAHRLTVEESPKKGKNGKLLVRCTKCGSYFTPTILETQSRARALEGKIPGENRLYCSQACKDACEIYGVNYDTYTKHAQFERDPAWAKMVKERANFICERCGSTENLEAHHEIPVKLNPELVSDEDNGICLCHDCHKKAHAEEGCTLADLRKL